MFIRYNPYLTKRQALCFDRYCFTTTCISLLTSHRRYQNYKEWLCLKSTSCVVDPQGRTIILFVKNVLPLVWVEHLELVSAQLSCIVRERKQYIGYKTRGKHSAVRFGSIIEQGGSGKICHSEDNIRLRDFIEKNHRLWNYIALIFALLCPEESKILLSIPIELRIFGGMFTAGYWNLEPLGCLHRDTRDWRWCCAISFGDFTDGLLDFPIINTSVALQKCDISFFWSKKLFHTVIDADPHRQSLVLTNHTAVLQRYNTDVLCKSYDHF